MKLTWIFAILSLALSSVAFAENTRCQEHASVVQQVSSLYFHRGSIDRIIFNVPDSFYKDLSNTLQNALEDALAPQKCNAMAADHAYLNAAGLCTQIAVQLAFSNIQFANRKLQDDFYAAARMLGRRYSHWCTIGEELFARDRVRQN